MDFQNWQRVKVTFKGEQENLTATGTIVLGVDLDVETIDEIKPLTEFEKVEAIEE